MLLDVEAVIPYVPAKYGAVAALAMLTYDYAITFDDEFEFVWKRRWSLGKILFIFIYAVYNCSRRLLLVMIAFLVAAIACSSWLAISTLSTVTLMMVSGTTGCPIGTAPPHAFLCWIPFLIFETFLVALMLCKGWRVYRSEGGTRLLHLIIRDSLCYFWVMLMTLLANCIVWVTPSLDPTIATGCAIAMPCAVGCRLLLNMRERFYKETTSIWTVMSA
ncbi:hypothetical protein JB92DRAFT_2924018 [Gautieria morchelliformis]|nr:hypothetical protein JB92DRAFT_2924018 [Gautieria morchelliformis]